ncbi:MAG: winged helix-turn-helix transcriptional regulator [Nitrospinae bacterium]|nr:winged helix-turn-helix transcriptional regulator [Nitrospinota bacterium]
MRNDERSMSGKYEAQSRIAKALSHPTRLFLLDQIAEGERCVCELKGLVDADLSTVSRHLTALKEVGLIIDRRRGTQVFYRIGSPHAHDVTQLLADMAKEEAEGRLDSMR